jgi:hypothetical protein
MSWWGLVSELPLVAEFCVRNGATATLLNILGEANPSPAYLIMLRHLEDMITLNFTIFRDADYIQLSRSVSNFLYITQQQLGRYQADTATKNEWAGKAIPLRSLFYGIIELGTELLKECEEARYLYVKTLLESGLNLEINQDKATVQTYLSTLGFSTTLSRSLEEAEHLYQAGGNEFDLKASMGHLRSFLEGLHSEAFPTLHARFGGELPTRWGEGLKYFSVHKVFSKSEELYAASLYTLISDEGVHPLVAEREYARLFRNVVIEYALLFLRKIGKLGLSQRCWVGAEKCRSGPSSHFCDNAVSRPKAYCTAEPRVQVFQQLWYITGEACGFPKQSRDMPAPKQPGHSLRYNAGRRSLLHFFLLFREPRGAKIIQCNARMRHTIPVIGDSRLEH